MAGEPDHAAVMGDRGSDRPAAKDTAKRIGDRSQHSATKGQNGQIRKDRTHKVFEVELARLNKAAERTFGAREGLGQRLA